MNILDCVLMESLSAKGNYLIWDRRQNKVTKPFRDSVVVKEFREGFTPEYMNRDVWRGRVTEDLTGWTVVSR